MEYMMGTDRLFNLSEKLGNIGSWEMDIVGCKKSGLISFIEFAEMSIITQLLKTIIAQKC
jgi:hypothetical protein